MPPPTRRPYSKVAEWSTPPAVNRPPSPLPVLLLPAKYLLGCVFTTCVILLVVPLIPFFLFVRLMKYIKDKIFLPRSCDILWPRSPFTRSFLWLNRKVSPDSIQAILDSQPTEQKKCCFAPTLLAPVEVMEWDHEKTPLRSHDDLVTFVKEKINHVPYVVQVKTIDGFEGNNRSTVLAITSHPDSFPLCMTRIVTALSQGNVTIEVEPRVYFDCSVDPELRFQTLRRWTNIIFHWIECYCLGPFFVLVILPRFKPEKVWRALIADRNQVLTYRRRWSLGGQIADSESSQLCIASSVQLKDEMNVSFNITEIANVDELQKVERLLRATMAELLVSFLAGALRRYFRENDPAVQHPPDCCSAFTVCNDKSSLCSESHPCQHLVLPIALPIGIEGMIPRLWALQRQFSWHVRKCTPQSFKAFNATTRLLLPRETANKVANLFFNNVVLNIAFLRIHGDVMLDSSLLTRYIPIPPLNLPSRASFVFVQQRDKILLLSSIDRGLFERHTDIFKHMRTEQEGLLDHLSLRMRSLTQTCVLPDRLPSEEVRLPNFPVVPEAPNNSPSGDGDEMLGVAGPSRPRRQSMADLNVVLEEVQAELDEMRRNPSVEDRDGTIQRLRDLEAKIESFHLGIKSELWGNTVWVNQEKDEAMARVAELLAPYQRRVSLADRKLSRRASHEYKKLRRASATTIVSTRNASREEEDRRASEGRVEDREDEMEMDGRGEDERLMNKDEKEKKKGDNETQM